MSALRGKADIGNTSSVTVSRPETDGGLVMGSIAK